MTVIPHQLQNDNFRFIKISPSDKKKPCEKFWTCTTLDDAKEKWRQQRDNAIQNNKQYDTLEPTQLSNYTFNDTQILDWINNKFNYGVMTGVGTLIVIDCDNAILQDYVNRGLPDTFQVKTSKGYHNYYFCANQGKIVFKQGQTHLGELQSYGQQVIGPTCIHPSQAIYEISKDIQIAEINASQIFETFPHDIICSESVNDINKNKKQRNFNKYNLKLTDIIPLDNFRRNSNGDYQGPHPIHGSAHGMNFAFNEETWCCFRENPIAGGGIIEWLAIKDGLITCGETLSDEKYTIAFNNARDKYGLKIIEIAQPIVNNTADVAQLRIDVLEDIAARDRHNATERVVTWLEENRRIYSMRDDKSDEMWIYDNGIYVANGKTYVQELCRDVLGQAHSTQFVTNVLDKIRADTFINAKDFFERKNKDSICVQNGYLNIVTRELRPYNSNEIFFEKLPIYYDPNADCPMFKKHLKDVLKHDEDYQLMCEILGHLLYNDYRFENAVMMSGSGSNGKTKTAEMIIKFLGQQNVSAVSLQAICKESFSRAELLNKRANICGEVSDAVLDETAWFKKLTGREYVSANRKGLPYIEFYNNAKLIFNLNEIPQTTDLTDGFFRRWIILEFPYKFMTQEDIDKLPENEKSMAQLRDTRHVEKMATQDELNGMLNFALDGVARLNKTDKMSYSKSTDEVRKIWVRKSDSFASFCEEMVREDYDKEIKKEDLRREYASYCKTHKLRSIDDKKIKATLEEKFGVGSKLGTDETGSRCLMWVGIRMRDFSKLND